MEDEKILDLYWARQENAIVETQNKYGNYCQRIAYNILLSTYDAEECVNDTYAKAWNTIPPARPERLGAYLGKITRHIALNRLSYDNAKKRNSHMDLIYEEVEEILPAGDGDPTEALALKEAIEEFLDALTKQSRIIFLKRYWYMASISQIATVLGLTENNVKVTLLRTRKKLKAHLERKGIYL